MDWLDVLAVQGILKSLLQHHSSKASILQHSAFFIVQLSHPYLTTGKTIALTRWIFVGNVMSLLFNMLSSLVIAFLSRSEYLWISWLHSPSAVILEPTKIKSVTVWYLKSNGFKFPVFFPASTSGPRASTHRDIRPTCAQWRALLDAYFSRLGFLPSDHPNCLNFPHLLPPSLSFLCPGILSH